MSKDIWGATAAEWEAFSALCLADIRPCVMNPHVDTLPTKARPISGKTGSDFSKRPSKTYDGKAAGILGWTSSTTTLDDVEEWKLNPDLGCGFVGRTIKAIDIDIDDPALAEEVDEAVAEAFGTFLPSRTRPGSPRRMLLYRFDEDDSGRKKQVIRPAAGGQVEFLFDRSFFVLAGRHGSGERQLWEEGIPKSMEEIPTISIERLNALIRQLAEEFNATGEIDEIDTNFEFAPRAAEDVDTDDPTFKHVVNSEYFRGFLPDGQISVKCPWWEQHSDGVEFPVNTSVTTVFPKGLGGNNDFMGFKCQHTSHGPKSGAEFLEAIGYMPEEFEVLDEEPSERALTRPKFHRVSNEGKIFFNELDLSLALEWVKGLGYDMAYDEFRSELQIKSTEGDFDWRPFTDSDYHRLSIALIKMGFASVNDSKLKTGVRAHGEKYSVDSAIEWIDTLQWDGVDRLSTFHTKVLKTYDTPYAQAVVYYMFTTMAARVLDPGTKADMVPVLSGRQGTRKTTFVHALAPFEKWACRLDLGGADADSSRMIVGKVIAELDELRGLGTREEEGIKSWITKSHEEWIPKFMEMTRMYKRRCLFIGTTNARRFLQDATGERRWLPLQVCIERGTQIDTEYVEANLEQLWAQGKELYLNNGGIMWEKAEHLAMNEHQKFAVRSMEQEVLSRWIHTEGKYEFTSYEALTEGMRLNGTAYGAPAARHRVERALINMGYEEEDDVWSLPFL